LAHNAQRAQALAPDAELIAVIKANAYGHGMVECAAALDPYAKAYALLSLEEARALRAAGCTKPLLLLEGVFDRADYFEVARLQLMPVIHRLSQIEDLEAPGVPVPQRIFLKVDSGMHRLGFAPRDLLSVFSRVMNLRPAPEVVLMSHYASADESGGAKKQMQVLDNLVVIHPELADLSTSFANSAGVMAEAGFATAVTLGDWVRTGLMLYGASPLVGRTANELGLKPVMSLESRLISVRQIEARDAVGYGRSFIADRPMRVGVVACGYADGYPRHAPTGTPVVVAGQRTRIIGRVSMDMLSVDLTQIPEADVGSPVELFGASLPVDELATQAGTIAYEILTAIAARVPRVFE
jgi:alanine racemase